MGEGREGGYIKVWRRLESSPVYQALRSGEQAHVLITLLLMANWKESTVWIGGRSIALKPGDILATQETIARRAKTSRKVVRTVLKHLHNAEFLVSTRLWSGHAGGQAAVVLTIRNWEDYQGVEPNVGPTRGPTGARPGPDLGPTGARSKEGEEQEEGKERSNGAKKARKKRSDEDTPRGRLFAHWRDKVWPQCSSRPYLPKEADFIQLSRALRQLSEADVVAAMDRVPAHPFWAGKDLGVVCARGLNSLLAHGGGGALPVGEFDSYTGQIDFTTGKKLDDH